ELVLEKDQTATGAGFAVGIVAEGIVRTKAFRGLAASDPTSDVILLVDEIVPERPNGALIVPITGLGGNVCHRRIAIHGTDGVADRCVLLLHRHVALVVIVPPPPAIEQELGKLNVAITVPMSFHVVNEPSEPDEGLFHFLVAVEPFLLAWSKVGH